MLTLSVPEASTKMTQREPIIHADKSSAKANKKSASDIAPSQIKSFRFRKFRRLIQFYGQSTVGFDGNRNLVG